MIEKMYGLALINMETALFTLQQLVPPPQDMEVRGNRCFRYAEKTTHQAVILKLVRYVSGLRAARLLLEYGFVQELGALQRMLHELGEDITFLVHPIIFGKASTEHHEKYLADFWQEQWKDENGKMLSIPRSMVPRQKIRAYVANMTEMGDPSGAVAASRAITDMYSGFVHSSAPHIMDLYGGRPAHFHLSGMVGTPRQEEHRDDLWNQYYRGLLTFCEAAKAFGQDELCDQLLQFSRGFAAQANKEYFEGLS